MKKIPTLFVRDFANNPKVVTRDVTPGCEWVIDGSGVASRKWDGTAALVRGGVLFKRYDAKNGKAPPPGFEPAQEPDAVTGHWPGWLKVGPEPESWAFRMAWEALAGVGLEDGTYELCGPKVGGNKEQLEALVFKRHGADVINAPRTFPALQEWFSTQEIEGVVWAYGERMCKIKRSDFGLRW